MFYLQPWAQQKNTVVSGAQSFEYFDKFYKDHIIFNFEPNPEKNDWAQIWILSPGLKRTYVIFIFGPH